jgi:hypothetical protein
MPELRIKSGHDEAMTAIYVSSIMKFPRNEKLAKEYCARARLDFFRLWCTESPEKIKLTSHGPSLLSEDLEIVLNTPYADGQTKFLEMSKVRTRRGIWAGNVLFQYVTEMHKSPDVSVNLARINAFEVLESGNNEGMFTWWPDSKKDHGKKTWQEFKAVSHLWCATVRVQAHIDELCGKIGKPCPTTQEVIRDNLQYILSLANWIFLEIKSTNDCFFDPHETWVVPQEYPIIPIKEVFALLSIK